MKTNTFTLILSCYSPPKLKKKVYTVFKKLFLSLPILLSSITAVNAEVVVVVHPSNAAAIDAKVIQKMFLGKEKKFSTGNAVKPINLESSNPLRASFDESIVGRSSSQVAAYWSKLVFTGKGVPPSEVGSDADVIAIVSSDADAIGYIDSSSINDSVKVIPVN